MFLHMHVSLSARVFIKQLELRLAVARRRVRQLHMAGKGTSQREGSDQGRAARTWGHSETVAAYVIENSFCALGIIADQGINNMCLRKKLYDCLHLYEVSWPTTI